MINALNIIPVKTDSCPKMGDYAIMKKMNRPWKERKKGDLVMFDFNGNGTSDHIGLLIKTNKDGSITTIEGNTGSGDDTNGGQVQKRTRYRNQVNYMVRPNYTDEITADMVIATAEAELGVKESPKNSNKVKYNRWFYGKNIAAFWCCTCMCWMFAHVKEPEKPWTKPKGKYGSSIPNPTLKKRNKGKRVTMWQMFLNWYGNINLQLDGEFGENTEKYTKKFQKAEGLKADGVFGPKSYAKAIKYLPEQTSGENPGTYKGTYPDLIKHGREKIVQTALELAYPRGTSKSKYTYGVGEPKPAYKKALKEAYPNRSTWSKQCRAGASCDVGAGTILRISGVDKKISRALAKQIPHLQKSDIWKKTSLKNASSMEPGDVGIYSNYGPGAHIWVGIGNGKIVESNHTAKCFLHVDTDNYTSSNKKVWGIYRSQKPIALRKGDKTKQVKFLRRYLNYYGDYGLDKDKELFNEAVENAVKDFQAKEGLTVTGRFGSKELKKAKAVRK